MTPPTSVGFLRNGLARIQPTVIGHSLGFRQFDWQLGLRAMLHFHGEFVVIERRPSFTFQYVNLIGPGSAFAIRPTSSRLSVFVKRR